MGFISLKLIGWRTDLGVVLDFRSLSLFESLATTDSKSWLKCSF